MEILNHQIPGTEEALRSITEAGMFHFPHLGSLEYERLISPGFVPWLNSWHCFLMKCLRKDLRILKPETLTE